MNNNNKITSNLQALETQRATLIRELLDLFPMISGAFKEVFRKCGKPNCWCAQQERGHSLRRITWSENGQSHSKAVADNEIDWFIIATENYRKFNQLKKRLEEMDGTILKCLDEYAKCQIEISRNDRDAMQKNAKT